MKHDTVQLQNCASQNDNEETQWKSLLSEYEMITVEPLLPLCEVMAVESLLPLNRPTLTYLAKAVQQNNWTTAGPEASAPGQ